MRAKITGARVVHALQLRLALNQSVDFGRHFARLGLQIGPPILQVADSRTELHIHLPHIHKWPKSDNSPKTLHIYMKNMKYLWKIFKKS